jgi:cathepsin B
MTMKEARTFASSSSEFDTDYPEKNWGALLDYFAAPTKFDSRVQWPNCIHPIRDQGQCGSCWAFAASESLSDRLCIAGGANVVLSPQWLVDCNTQNYGCNGGYPIKAWQFMMTTGIVADACVPYTAADGKCPASCTGTGSMTKYYASSANTYSNPASIQAEIMATGPIEAAFTVYQDFMSYTSGVYIHTWGSQLGGHAVKMIGWGVSGTTNYWICANSWNTNWGIQGYFWIEFGQCGIDSQCVGGNAKV